jgi:predicted HicB family RNase H-like nuclease
MRPSVHGTTLRLSVSGALRNAAEERARSEGMTLSELVRHALRQEVKRAA